MSDCKCKTQDGYCTKYGGRHKCKPSTINDFDETVKMINVEEVCRGASLWGNSLCYITEEQLEELKNGKAIYINDGEYCTFIVLKKETDCGN